MLQRVLLRADYYINLPPRLPLLRWRPGLAFVSIDRVHHDLVGILRGIGRVTFAPVVADGICENCARLVEIGCADSASDVRVTFQPMLCILVPEVKGTIRSCCAESSMYGMEGYRVDRVHICHVADWRITVTFKGEIMTTRKDQHNGLKAGVA